MTPIEPALLAESIHRAPTAISHDSSLADLAIELTLPTDIAPSDKNTYILTITNQGPDPATDILVSDLFPAGTHPDWIRPLQPYCQWDNKGWACDVGGLQDRDRVTVTLDLSANRNNPPIPKIQLPGVQPDSAVPVCMVTQIAGQTRLLCRLDSLQPGTRAQVRVDLRSDSQPVQASLHTASVSAAEFDPDLSNNSVIVTTSPSPASTEITPSTDLMLQADGPATVIAGQPFTYTYTVTNQGTHAAAGVTFEDVIPADLRLVDYAPGLPTCKQKGMVLTCSLRDPDSGETVTFTLELTGHEEQPVIMDVDPLMLGWPLCYVLKERDYLHILHCDFGILEPGQSTHVQLDLLAIGVRERTTTNTATVQAQQADLLPADNSVTTTLDIRVQADLLVGATNPVVSTTGDAISYTIRVNNLGPSAADDVILTDALPTGYILDSTVLEAGDDCRVENDGTLACSLGYLESGETTTVNVTLTVEKATIQAGELIHSVEVGSASPDPNLDNNLFIGSLRIGEME